MNNGFIADLDSISMTPAKQVSSIPSIDQIPVSINFPIHVIFICKLFFFTVLLLFMCFLINMDNVLWQLKVTSLIVVIILESCRWPLLFYTIISF